MVEDLLAGFRVVIEQNVVWGEMDAYRHVNNVVYFRYFENVRTEYTQRIDWPAFEDETGIGPILAATSCRFRKPLTYPDAILIGTRASALGTDRIFMEYRIVSRKLSAVAAEGEATIVSYNYRRNEKAPVPEEIRRRIAELEGVMPATR